MPKCRAECRCSHTPKAPARKWGCCGGTKCGLEWEFTEQFNHWTHGIRCYAVIWFAEEPLGVKLNKMPAYNQRYPK